MATFRLIELAEHIGGTLKGNADLAIDSIAALNKAQSSQITFISNAKYRENLTACQAGAIIVSPADAEFCAPEQNLIIVDNPYVAYAKLAQYMDSTPKAASQIHPSAVISSDAKLGHNVSVGANAVIESGVVLGDDVVIGAGCFVGKGSRIGARTQLWANVSIYHGVQLGEDCLIQSSAVIGSDGFGYANEKGQWIKIPQTGGALDPTVIEDNVIIDNLCQIAHNVHIGYGTAVAGGVIMAGSLKVGKFCQIGGASVINGHMEICDGAIITGMCMVMKPITEKGIYSSGIPAQTNKEWRKTAALTLNIDEMNKRLKALEKRLSE